MTTDSQSQTAGKKKATRQNKKANRGDSASGTSSPAKANQPGGKSEPAGLDIQPQGLPSAVSFRRLPKGLRSALGEKSRFLFWGLPEQIAGSPSADLLEKLQQAIVRDKSQPALATAVAELLNEPPVLLSSGPGLFIALGASYGLPQLAGSGSAQAIGRIAESIRQLSVSEELDVEANPVGWLVAAVEIPLVLGLVEQPIDSHKQAELVSRFNLFVEQNLEEEGWLPQAAMGDLAVLHASLLRCQTILDYLGQKLEEKVAHRLEWMTRNLFRLLDHGGHQLLDGGRVEDLTGLARAARRVTTDEEDSRLLKAIETDDFPAAKRLPDCSDYCDETLTAVLRGNWTSRAGKLAIQVVGVEQRVEIGARETIIRGNWTPEIAFNGETLASKPGTVEINCWSSDHESDYLEFQTQLSGGVIWQRQYALDKREQVLFIGDVFLGSEPGRWEYRCQVPLAAGISVDEARESRELRLLGAKSAALALPLSMGEWKADRTDDAFVAGEQGLECRQTRRGQACMFAVVVDLDQKRARRPATWRILTVGENLKPVPRDQALAFRFQFGKQQWLAYRSLTPIASRTYLGQNVYSEFSFDRFLEDGTAESLVSVE